MTMTTTTFMGPGLCKPLAQAARLRRSILAAFVLAACFLAIPVAAQAQINPEIANCAELKDEATVTQADLCAAHIGCRFVLNVQKTCARAKGYLERLQTAIGEGTRTFFGYRKEVTPDSVFMATLNGEDRDNERKLGGLAQPQQQVQQIGTQVRDVGGGDILSGKGGSGTTWVYYGQVQDGKSNGTGSRIFSSGEIQRGQFKNDQLSGTGEILFANGGRYVGNYMDKSREGLYVFKSGRTEKGTRWTDGTFIGDQMNVDGTQFKGRIENGVLVQGRSYRADGSLAEEGRYENGQLSVGTRYDTANNRTEVNLPQDLEVAKRAQAEKVRLAQEAEQQNKREQAAQAEQQFRASLQTMDPGQLFARADELNAQGDRARARDVQRALMSRFPDHPMAATAARQMAGESGGNPLAGGNAAPSGAAIVASRPAGGRLSGQACEAMKQSVITTKVPTNASVTAAMETVMFMTKTEIDMIDGGCPTEPGVTPAQIAAARKERQQQYTTAEQNCNAVQSGDRRCVARAYGVAQTTSKPPAPAAAAGANRSATISYDPVTGRCLPVGSAECCQLPSVSGSGAPECGASRGSTGGGIRTAR